MSSEDVIELGSSDEDTQPPPKRRKPLPNVIVQFPDKLPGLTIQPAKSATKFNPACIAKGTLGKSVTVTKVSNANLIANPYANKNKPNGKAQSSGKRNTPPVMRNVHIPLSKHFSKAPLINPQVLQNVAIKPLRKIQVNTSIVDRAQNPPKMPQVNVPIHLVKFRRPNASTPAYFPKCNPKPISNLPPGLIIKKTSSLTKNAKSRYTGQIKNPLAFADNLRKPSQSNEVLTVDLDDEEPGTSGGGRQWYLRPEDQNTSDIHTTFDESVESSDVCQSSEDITRNSSVNEEANEMSQKQSPEKCLEGQQELTSDSLNLQEMNNKEPENTNFIEITIEDSPIKPIHYKKGFRVGAELAITIDDSPIKGAADKTPPGSGSDDEHIDNAKEPNSKKRLDYPNEMEIGKVIEIEIEPLAVVQSISHSEEFVERNMPKPVDNFDIVEIEESPIKPNETEEAVTPKKINQAKPQVKMNKIDSIHPEEKEKGEFHPAYQTFIDLCFKLENSEDMEKIVEKKIKSYYRQVPKDYTESEMFIEIVLSKVAAMKVAPEKMYLYIKDIVDELDTQRKIAKREATAKVEEQEKFLYGEESEFDSKRQRQIRKLEKTLKKLHRAIQKLEEQEVDFDDEEDSVYLLTERYKERMVRVHAKLCQLTNTKMPSEPRILIDARPGQPKGPAKRLEKWINKKVPIGTPLPFPDFHDVLRCVRDANQQDKLGWNEADIMEEARDLFTRCGKKLQRRRQENEWRLAVSRIQTDGDPAENSTDLQKKLEENTRVAAKRETEVLNKYADRQKQLKLEAVEIGDKEAEESPVESDDEEPVDDNTSLENTEKRKERLKRLLQEKSKRGICDKKENQSESQPVVQKDKETSAKDAEEEKREHNKTEDNNLDVSQVPVKIMNIDSVELEICSNKDDKEKSKSDDGQNDKVHSLSDDSNKVESDIDELHLLQKLHSGNEIDSSTLDSSDSDSPIAISDGTMTDGSACGNTMRSSDVISIENSSYSEADENKDGEENEKTTNEQHAIGTIEETMESNELMECSNEDRENRTKANTREYTESLEEILLASSDDNEEDPKDIGSNTETCLNLRDDNISIGETIIEDSQKGERGSQEKELNSVNTDNKVDTSSVESMDIVIEYEEEKVTEVNSIERVTEINNINLMETEVANTSASTGESVKTIVDETTTKTVKTHEKVITIDESRSSNHIINENAVDTTEKTDNRDGEGIK